MAAMKRFACKRLSSKVCNFRLVVTALKAYNYDPFWCLELKFRFGLCTNYLPISQANGEN